MTIMLEKTKTLVAPIAAAAALAGSAPNTMAHNAETSNSIGAIAANQAKEPTTVNEAVRDMDEPSTTNVQENIEKIFDESPKELSETHSKAPQKPKNPDAHNPNVTENLGFAPNEEPKGPVNSDIENGLAEINEHVMDMKLDAIEEVAFQDLAIHNLASNTLDKDPSKGPISTDSNHSVEEKRPNIVEAPPVEQQPSEEDALPPKNPYQPPEAHNPMGELAPNETGPLNNGLRDGVAVMEQHFSEMASDPYQPPQTTVEAPATKTPASGQNNGSENGAPAEVPAP